MLCQALATALPVAISPRFRDQLCNLEKLHLSAFLCYFMTRATEQRQGAGVVCRVLGQFPQTGDQLRTERETKAYWLRRCGQCSN